MNGMRGILIVTFLCTAGACSGTAEERPSAQDVPPSATADPEPTAADSRSELAEPESSRMIVRRARIEIQTEAVDDAASDLGALAERFGGYIERSDGTAEHGDFQRFEATLRVPGERFEPAMGALRAIGDVVQEKVDATDVTAEVSDVEAQVHSHRTLESRLLGLLTTTESIEDALRVEEALVRVRSTIETLEGRRLLMARQVAMSNIEVVLVHPAAPGLMAKRSVGDEIGEATEDARALSISVLGGLIRIFGAMLPLLLIGGPLVYATRRGLARRQRSRSGPPAPPTV